MKLPALSFLFGMLTATALFAASPATPEATTTDFFNYLLKSKHDIAKDTAAQTRWLSHGVRHALAEAEAGSDKAAKAHPNEQIDSPDNGTFLAAWDPPSSFKVTAVKSTPPTAHVDLLFTWGAKSQYPGETRVMTASLALEDGAWHITDIHSHAARFNPDTTLLGDLRKMAKQR
jgi:hypothetical protein